MVNTGMFHVKHSRNYKADQISYSIRSEYTSIIEAGIFAVKTDKQLMNKYKCLMFTVFLSIIISRFTRFVTSFPCFQIEKYYT